MTALLAADDRQAEQGVPTRAQSALPAARHVAIDPKRAAVNRLGYTFCEQHLVIPVALADGRLEVRASEDSASLRRMIRQHAGIRDVVIQKADPAVLVRELPQAIGIRSKNETTRVQQIIDDTFLQSASLNASDVLLEPEVDCAHLRMDCQGIYRHVATFTMDEYERIISLLGPRTFKSFDPYVGQKGRYTFNADGRELHLRGTSWPRWLLNTTKPKLDYRVLQPYYIMRTLEQLGMRKIDRERFIAYLSSAKCGAIVSGPPGSGKTSTIFAGLIALNPQNRNIYSIEEPPEIYVPFIHSTEITDRWSHDDAIALTNRLNADFVNVGEALNQASAVTTLNHTLAAVPTSTSVHADDFVGAVRRLKALKIELERIETGVTLWVSQRLLNPVCRHCSIDVPTPSTVREIFAALGMPPPQRVRERRITLGQGEHECDECFGHGITQDRRAVFEVVPTSAKLREAIRAEASADELANAGYNKDVWPMIASGIRLLTDGVIDHGTFLKIPVPFGATSTWL